MSRRSPQTLLRSIRKKMFTKEVTAGPPLRVKDVTAFEKKHGVKLPGEYVTFLREIGNGARREADGLYALLPLGEVWKGSGITRARALAGLAKPFPHGRSKKRDPQRAGTLGKTSWNGCLPVGGDAFDAWGLVVADGVERGTMWQLSADGVVPNNPPRNFLEWYDYWLDGEPDDWWDGIEPEQGSEPEAKPVPDPLKPQRDAISYAEAVVDKKPASALEALMEVTSDRLQGQVQFLRAVAAAVAKQPGAERLALAAADSWLGPVTAEAVNQGVERGAMLELLDRFDSAAVRSKRAEVEVAPLPDMFIPEGGDYF
jgi:hypothetical protein